MAMRSISNSPSGKSLSYLSSLHSKYKAHLNLTKEEIDVLLAIQKKHLDAMQKKHGMVQDRLLRFSKLLPTINKKRDTLQKIEIQGTQKRIEGERLKIHQEKATLNRITADSEKLENERRDQIVQLETWKSKRTTIESTLEEFDLWINVKHTPAAHRLQENIHQSKTIQPAIRAQILQAQAEVNAQEKQYHEALQQINQLLKLEDRATRNQYKHQESAFEHKLKFERLKVAHAQIHLLLRINQSTKNDYRRKLAEMEMNRDDIQLDIERVEKELGELQIKLLEEHEKLHTLKLKLEALQETAFQNGRSLFSVSQEILQKQNVLMSRQSRVKQIINSLSELRKQKQYTQQEVTRLEQNRKSLEEEREKKQEQVSQFQSDISESYDKYRAEKMKRSTLKKKLDDLASEMNALDLKIHETRKMMESLKQKTKKDKQDLIEAQRTLQVQTRKHTLANEKSDTQEKDLNEAQSELGAHNETLSKVSKSDRKQILKLRGKIGTLEFNIQEMKLSLQRLKDEERMRNNDLIIAKLEVEEKSRIHKQTEARSLEAIAENALLVKEKTELKKKVEDCKIQLQEQQKIVEDLKIRSSGDITKSKLNQLSITLQNTSIQTAIIDINSKAMGIKLSLMDRSIAFWEKKLSKWNTKVEEMTATIASLQAKEKEYIRINAQSQIDLERVRKSEYHTQLLETQSTFKQVKLCRGNLERYVIAREKFAALCKYLSWADERVDIPYTLDATNTDDRIASDAEATHKHTLEDLKNEFGKIENDIEDERHHIQTFKDVLKQDEMELDELNRKRLVYQVSNTSDNAQRLFIEQEHLILISEEGLNFDTKHFDFEMQSLKFIEKQQGVYKKELQLSDKHVQKHQSSADVLSNQISALQTLQQRSSEQLKKCKQEMSSHRDKLEVTQQKAYALSMKVSEVNAEIRLLQEEKEDISKMIEEITKPNTS